MADFILRSSCVSASRSVTNMLLFLAAAGCYWTLQASAPVSSSSAVLRHAHLDRQQRGRLFTTRAAYSEAPAADPASEGLAVAGDGQQVRLPSAAAATVSATIGQSAHQPLPAFAQL